MRDSTWVSLVIGRYGAAIWGLIALALSKWGIEFTDAETSQIMTGISAAVSVGLIIVSRVRGGLKDKALQAKDEEKKEPPSLINNCGRIDAGLMIIIFGGLVLGIALIVGSCATANMDHEAKLASARIIARHAGAHVAANNPALARRVVVAYDSVQKATGEPYLVSVEAILSQMLMDEGVVNSDLLLADAKDLAALMGFPMPLSVEEVDMEWMRQFDPGAVRSAAEAFVGAMR